MYRKVRFPELFVGPNSVIARLTLGLEGAASSPALGRRALQVMIVPPLHQPCFQMSDNPHCVNKVIV